MRVINRLAYQLSASTVSGTRLQDSSALHYPLYPLSSNIERMLRFSGTSNHSSISPYEASDLLYQLSKEDLLTLRSNAEQVDSQLKLTYSQALPIRLYAFVFNKEYRHQNFTKKLLNEKENFVSVSSGFIKKIAKIAEIDSLPVGFASNSIYAAARLKIDFGDVMEANFLPLLERKVGFLSSIGCAETLWALATLGITGPAFDKVFKELKGRKFEKALEVWTSPYNHLEYIKAQGVSEDKWTECLLRTADIVKDEEVKKVLRGLVSG